MAAAVPFLMIAGTAASALGAIHTAQANKASAKYNEQLALQNETASRQGAAVEEQRLRMQQRKQLGQMRANYGASGVTVDGSIEDVLADSATNAEWDALLVRHGGETQARGYRNEASLYGAQAKNASAAGYLAAAGALGQGAGQAYGAFKRMK
jgi:hypothetical protein